MGACCRQWRMAKRRPLRQQTVNCPVGGGFASPSDLRSLRPLLTRGENACPEAAVSFLLPPRFNLVPPCNATSGGCSLRFLGIGENFPPPMLCRLPFILEEGVCGTCLLVLVALD